MNSSEHNWLIADVGATTTRCAVFSGARIAKVHICRNDDMASLHDLIAAYRQTCGVDLHSCALAVAAPVTTDEVQMINRDWRFSRDSVRSLGFDRVEIINDFHAVAFALPELNDDTRTEIGKSSRYRDGNLAVLGPGSGLGMAAWIAGGGAMCGEGGHITLAARNAREDSIIARLRDRYGHCSAERILSGPGLAALHEAMHGTRLATSEEITAHPDTPQNAATLQQFFAFLGTVAADLALITGALGGVYIAGGIVPANIGQIRKSPFRSRFEDKNRYCDFMRAIPTWVITDPTPGLTGLAAYIARGS